MECFIHHDISVSLAVSWEFPKLFKDMSWHRLRSGILSPRYLNTHVSSHTSLPVHKAVYKAIGWYHLAEVIVFFGSWWRHQMETFSALLAICAGNSPVPGEFPAQRPVTRSFDVFFDLRLNKRLSKQSWGWWFETLSCSLWRHCNVLKDSNYIKIMHWRSISERLNLIIVVLSYRFGVKYSELRLIILIE